jgi:hypothetical protein
MSTKFANKSFLSRTANDPSTVRNMEHMTSIVQELAARIDMSVDDFVGEMRKRGCSEPTALKIWRGEYEHFEDFNDNDINLSNLRKASFVLKVTTGILLPK